MTPYNPSEKEKEYFAKQEYEKMKQKQHALRKQMQEEEKKKLKELHYMHCPKCGTSLVELELRDVMIDRCPECEGMWLDKGELETLVRTEKNSIARIMDIFR